MQTSATTDNQPTTSLRPLRDYAFPLCLIVAAAAAATLLRWLLDPLLADLSPFSTYYLAVAVAAILGGVRVASLTALACALAAHYFWVEPRGSLTFLNKSQMAQLFVFVLEAAIIAGSVSVIRFLNRDQTYPEPD